MKYEMRRVVVTGLGAVTPLGVGTSFFANHLQSLMLIRCLSTGVRRTWTSLLDGKCGIVSTKPLGAEFEFLPSRVAGLVPKGAAEDGGWNADEHVNSAVRFLLVLELVDD